MCLLKCQCDCQSACLSVSVSVCVGVSSWPTGQQHFTINLGATKASYYYSWPEATTERETEREGGKEMRENWQFSGAIKKICRCWDKLEIQFRSVVKVMITFVRERVEGRQSSKCSTVIIPCISRYIYRLMTLFASCSSIGYKAA